MTERTIINFKDVVVDVKLKPLLWFKRNDGGLVKYVARSFATGWSFTIKVEDGWFGRKRYHLNHSEFWSYNLEGAKQEADRIYRSQVAGELIGITISRKPENES